MSPPRKKAPKRPARKRARKTAKNPMKRTTKTSRARAEKKPRKKRAGGERISVQKYKEMYKAYIERQTASFVAKQCHVHVRTAAKYIEEGDPDRGLIPLAERFERVQAEASRNEDLSLSKAARETTTLVKAFKAGVGNSIQELLAGTGGKKLDPNQIGRNLKVINDLEHELLTDIEAKEKLRAPILTREESRAAAMAVIHHRQEQARLKREAEQKGGQVDSGAELPKKRKLKPPPKKK